MTDSSSANGAALRQLAERQTKILNGIASLEQSFRDLGSPLHHEPQFGATADVCRSDVGASSQAPAMASESPTPLNPPPVGRRSDVTLTKTGVGSIAQRSTSPSFQPSASVKPEESAQSQKDSADDLMNGVINQQSATSDAQPKATTSETNNGQGQSTQGASHRDQAATQQRLEKVCLDLGCKSVRFKSVPEDYYEQSLEERRDLLGAPSIDHLCKSIVLTNTQAPPEITDCSNPRCSKYYLVVVQYVAKLNTEKVKNFVYGLNDGKLPKKRINMRLAPSEVSDALTGYSHNSVTPFGMKTEIPIILSDAITKLEPPFFWLGAGEVDLKLGLDVSEFVEAVNPFVVDCT